jgi:3-deoxy-D-manno-octulosonic-acid transferase
MSTFLYNLFISIYSITARLIAPFNPKAKLWVEGRKNIFEKLQQKFEANNSPVIWVHCASLGEFEQGRPVIESLKKIYPSHKILLTFFSPSGYQVRKNYEHADVVSYLPVDTKKNAEIFFNITKPSLILFIKYEFWFYFLSEAKTRNIPLLSVSAIFRKDQPFFHWYGSLHKKMLNSFTCFFVQNEASLKLLHSLNFNNVILSGDTRFDRVSEIADNFQPIEIINLFCKNYPVIVAGSTWLEDDEELDHFANTHPEIRFIIVPHDVQSERIEECKKLYKNSIEFSAISNERSAMNYQLSAINTLIIDNVGMLSRLYAYATICYVGGAFGGDGVHNVLEGAVYGKPVVFGPTYEKYFEAVELIDAGGAFTVDGQLELEEIFNDLLNDKSLYTKSSNASAAYVKSKTGATENVIHFIQEKRLLIS